MRTVLLFGAGRSTSSLIRYLLSKSEEEKIRVQIADQFEPNLDFDLPNLKNLSFVLLNINAIELRQKIISEADIVISMLPADLHIGIAKDCLEFGKNLVTASYISDAMQSLDEAVRAKGLVFLNEVGLDPGIDHMSAMKTIEGIRNQGGKMLLFESFCGGLLAPESDDNLWNYKFTWSPRNVVLAGQGGAAKFLQEGTYKYIPYHQLFRRTEFLNIEGYGRFEAYPNRDSLKYRSVYGLDDVLTLYRGTIRRVGFSKAWNMFVQLGMTDDSYVIEDSEHMSYRDFVNSFLPYHPTDSVEIKMRLILNIDQDDIMWDKLVELDLFNAKKMVGLVRATPAQILQRILADSWTLRHEDKDMIVMYHKFGFELDGKKKQIDSRMVCIGEDQKYTAMAKTVGLPVGMAALLLLNGKITSRGVLLPIAEEIYEPILEELECYGITFVEEIIPYYGYNPDRVFNL